MASETESSADEEGVASAPTLAGGGEGGGGSDRRGKHRILAELKRLEQDSKFLEDELAELEKSENVSTICNELIESMESKPDPLLPEILGPVNLTWDRWFEGPQDPQACRCLIF
ncbi:hypothetical protein L6164_034490 [Bauhinia variegata]|uniref:Uncharacterized protein n=1 Tax=Bauhinia variegata TaxID=167791 RepID=A0ACB9KVL6_BAUVA|nr:hypothetical protein L6164_034490 [Bauhinia variegata]